jgi:hypothetical protein
LTLLALERSTPISAVSRWLCEAGAWGDPDKRPGDDFTSVMEGEAQAHVAGTLTVGGQLQGGGGFDSVDGLEAFIHSGCCGEEDGLGVIVRSSYMRTTVSSAAGR